MLRAMCVCDIAASTYVLLLLLFFVAVLVLRVCFAVFVTGLRAISDFIMILITYVEPVVQVEPAAQVEPLVDEPAVVA